MQTEHRSAMQSQHRSLPDLLSFLVNDISTLFTQEVRLARTETSEKIGQVANALVMLAVAVVLVIPGLVVLLQAITIFLVEAGMQEQWAALAVGLVVVALGLIFLLVGINRLKASNLVPERTIGQMQQDAAVAREQVR